MDTQKGNAGKVFKLSVVTLAIMNITAVVSLRGLPSEAIYGPSSAFYYLFAAIVFLIANSAKSRWKNLKTAVSSGFKLEMVSYLKNSLSYVCRKLFTNLVI